MCLLVLSHGTHESYRLVFAGNRDEFHARPAQAAHWWPEAPAILAGRDLEAGGTWLGITAEGRFAVVTNYRETKPKPLREAPSRGHLVTAFLQGHGTAYEFASTLHSIGDRYRGFSLIVGDGAELWFVSNRDGTPKPLGAGIYGLSNDLLDEPWPKVVLAKERLARLLTRDVAIDDLLELLDDRGSRGRPSTEADEPGIERALESIFVETPRYGTRCSTAITIARGGAVEFAERSFDAQGNRTGEARFEFRVPTRGPLQ